MARGTSETMTGVTTKGLVQRGDFYNYDGSLSELG